MDPVSQFSRCNSCFVTRNIFGIFPIDLTANHGVPPGPAGTRSPTATSPLQKPCPCTARKATETGRTLSHNCRKFSYQTKDLGVKRATVVCASFQVMGLSALWSPQMGSTLGTGENVTRAFWGCIGKGGALGLLLSQRSHPAKPQDPSLGHSPQPVPTVSPRAEDIQNCRVQGWLPSVPARSACPNCWCWCHQESFGKVLTRSSSSLLSTKETSKASPMRWLRHQAVKHKLQIRGGQYPFQVLMLEGR